MSAIIVENISKRYIIGHQRRADTLRDALTGGIRSLWGQLRNGTMEREEFWALRNVSFEVNPGEVVGIIGRNGAGKSTLLKILSRITEPTSGRITIQGRVASLLEVGTGFHPELSGRENIFLNGAILGMSRIEIRQKFDEIVDFAEVERFLDTPVKRYSSGMYVRLAFAVAAHLEPEILIVDEVLAVGDASFQEKCLGKLKQVANASGRAVIFVSHNLMAVRQLCSTGILLEQGKVQSLGKINSVIATYREIGRKRPLSTMQPTGFANACIVNDDDQQIDACHFGQRTHLKLEIKIQSGVCATAGFTLFNQSDIPLISSAAADSSIELTRGSHVFKIRMPIELLPMGTYRIEGAVWDKNVVYHQEDALCEFHVLPATRHEETGQNYRGQIAFREQWLRQT